ncbi:tautomerase family protein [Stappia sp. F7233]|uniref:Tautomerase family protein n=1 Tax=Stappia albiluteola TaxID=2758565 RepID=A0A839A985_9HYPH|nr:tautomerase family protein [Stappia albiluteola]MBA5775766.1 tautomerase family protein [Stappia albiluteola]
MPLTRISMRRGKSAEFKKAVMDNLYHAMRETFVVPADDQFMVIHEHDSENMAIGWNYMDIERSEDLLLIQLTVNNTRDAATKQALYKRIVERLAENPGVRPEDVFLNLVEVVKENWSFGYGDAQYA